MPAGSSWERGRREGGRGGEVGTDTKFFPRETWLGGGVEKKGENDTEKRKQGKKRQRERAREN